MDMLAQTKITRAENMWMPSNPTSSRSHFDALPVQARIARTVLAGTSPSGTRSGSRTLQEKQEASKLLGAPLAASGRRCVKSSAEQDLFCLKEFWVESYFF